MDEKICNYPKKGKWYTGNIDVPSDDYRTSDYFNRPKLMDSTSYHPSLDNYIELSDVKIYLDEKSIIRKESLNILVTDILFHWDNEESVGMETSRQHANLIAQKSGAKVSQINIITPTFNNHFYSVIGNYHPPFRKAMSSNFISLFDALAVLFCRQSTQDSWIKKSLQLPHSFIAVNINFIESYYRKDE